MSVSRAVFWCLAVSVIAACDSAPHQHADATLYNCATETRADTYAPNMVKIGSQGLYQFVLVESVPAPPAKGDNTWTLRILDLNDMGIDGATLTVTPFMPDHGHGTAIEAVVTPGGNGTYTADPVNLWMPGLWRTTIAVNDGGAVDDAVFAFCIEG
mgnify:CR=1 FL=1